MNDHTLLFCDTDVHKFFTDRTNQAKKAVDDIPPSQFQASTDDQIIEHVRSRLEVTPLKLYRDRAEMTEQESHIDVTHNSQYATFPGERCVVPSVKVIISIPYFGDKSLWRIKPNPFLLNSPRGIIQTRCGQDAGILSLEIHMPTGEEPSKFKTRFDEQLTLLETFITNQTRNIATYNQQLPAQIRGFVQARRSRLEKQNQVRNILNIPLARRPGAPEVQPLAVPRKLIRPLPPPPDTKPEPGVRDEDYEHILSVIRHEGKSFETTPATFAKHDEEELRDIILAHLNGHYHGDATGERFRKKGKTDICIEAENRAAFIAECKVWRGPKECTQAVDQLLSYLTWRDCKCSLVFFNTKIANFSLAQRNLASAMAGHALFVCEISPSQAGEWRFRFKQPVDEQRIVTVHVFFFDLLSVTGVHT